MHVVCTDNFAGAERSVVLSSRAIADRGHRVTVIGGEAATMRRLLEGSGVDWRPGATIPAGIRALASVGRADIVHAHMTAAELAAVAARPFHRGRLVVTRHFAQHRGLSPVGHLAAAVVNHTQRTEIAISAFVAERLECPSTIVHHGIEDRPAVVGDGRTVVVVQRLEAEKHTGVAIRAWKASGLGGEGWRLQIAGDGAERAALQALATGEGVRSSVDFLGRVDDVDALRAGAALQLATPPTEHFGLSVLEAMAVGLPVIAADGGAHRELLGDEDAALFAVGSVGAAAAVLRALALDPVARQGLGQRLQARQRERFSLAAHGEALERVYRSAVAGGRA